MLTWFGKESNYKLGLHACRFLIRTHFICLNMVEPFRNKPPKYIIYIHPIKGALLYWSGIKSFGHRFVHFCISSLQDILWYHVHLLVNMILIVLTNLRNNKMLIHFVTTVTWYITSLKIKKKNNIYAHK